MKKLLSFILALAAACTVQTAPSIADDPFISNLLSLDLHEIHIGLGADGSSVYRIGDFQPLDYSIGPNSFQFARRNIPYLFVRSLDRQRAVFRYPGFSRGSGHEYRVYIGLVLYKDGLYQAAKKQSSPAADTLEATAYFYSIENIDFDTLVPGPLYQKPGTEVGLK